MTYLNLIWHFHQPWYLAPDSDTLNVSTITFRVLYNYYPMAKMIEDSGSRVCCNFTVPLLLQIQKIANGEITDGFQKILTTDTENDLAKTRIFCQDLPERVKNKYAIFKNLIEKLNSGEISKQELSDLKTWMHLCCFHPVMGKYFPEIEELKKKGVGFNQKDRELLLQIEKSIFSNVISIYKRLYEQELIEISITPGYHPIMPLIYDIKIALQTKTLLKIPDIEFSYPEDVTAHIEKGFELAEKVFGKKPIGIWPAEGSLSEQVLDVLAGFNIAWVGADEQILYGSNVSYKDPSSFLYTWKDAFFIFFRNHDFSDRIGFIYQSWNEKDAADDMVKRIEDLSGVQEKMLTIILDGENPWEWYRQEGSIFLSEFYQRVILSKNIRMMTPAEMKNLNVKKVLLETIHPGSWMGLHFDNWIGSDDANNMWKILADARKTVKQHYVNVGLNEKLKNLILLAESSDFLWWMSVPASQQTKMKFFTIFQAIISTIYKELGMEIPTDVLQARIFDTKIEEPTRYINPKIDGRITDFFEWSGAAKVSIEKLWTTFQPFDLPVKKLFYGYDRENLYIRIDIVEQIFSVIQIESKEFGEVFVFESGKNNENFAIEKCIEIKVPIEKFIDENVVSFAIKLKTQDTEMRIPPAGFVSFEKKSFEDDWII
ncbi:MAG: hypothetical protein NC913_06460 [Candidatus Omnitrophica bacterium]|nr:hypothetical protein [Candidatus Omnitrophota bacterium]